MSDVSREESDDFCHQSVEFDHLTGLAPLAHKGGRLESWLSAFVEMFSSVRTVGVFLRLEQIALAWARWLSVFCARFT
jgi:hypothetical protein